MSFDESYFGSKANLTNHDSVDLHSTVMCVLKQAANVDLDYLVRLFSI